MIDENEVQPEADLDPTPEPETETAAPALSDAQKKQLAAEQKAGKAALKKA